MKSRFIFPSAVILFVILMILSPVLAAAQPGMGTLEDLTALSPASDIPRVLFIENVGQFDRPGGAEQGAGALFQVRGGGRTIWLAEDAIWITVVTTSGRWADDASGEGSDAAMTRNRFSQKDASEGMNIKLSFPGANAHPQIEPVQRMEARISYFIGNDPAKWHAEVPVWGGVRYKNLYPGIDLEATSENGQLVLRMVPYDGADLSAVGLRVEGADSMALEGDSLQLTTASGEFSLPLLQANPPSRADAATPAIIGNVVASPFAYQDSDGADLLSRAPAAALLTAALDVPQKKALTVGSQGHKSNLLYSTYLGASGNDTGNSIAVDSNGAVYFTGATFSNDFPTSPGAFDGLFNYSIYSDTFVVKINPAGFGGSDLIYATYLGGQAADVGRGIAVDSNGAAYITGETFSSDFPITTGAFDSSFNLGSRSDAFIAKLSPNGSGISDLAYSTFIGDVGDAIIEFEDIGYAIALGPAGAVYITGKTTSENFPTTSGAYDEAGGGDWRYPHAYLLILNPAGSGTSDLLYGTILKGTGTDEGFSVAVDSSGAAFITGRTNSTDFPVTSGAFSTSYNSGTSDAFVVKLNPAGSGAADLVYGTYWGESGGDWGNGIAVCDNGMAYITGVINYSPSEPPPHEMPERSSAFVMKLDSDGSSVVHSQTLSGGWRTQGKSIALNSKGNAFITGWTSSDIFPTTSDAFDTSFNGIADAFVMQVKEIKLWNGHGFDIFGYIAYSSFLGGVADDQGNGIVLDANDVVYITGATSSYDFPTTTGAYKPAFDYSLTYDAFIAKLVVYDSFAFLPFSTRN